jgi:hypothetical protein
MFVKNTLTLKKTIEWGFVGKALIVATHFYFSRVRGR